jgi:transcriptional regulator with XRE-family HTH domain
MFCGEMYNPKLRGKEMTDELMRIIGARTKELREKSSEPLSQEELAAALRGKGQKVEQAQIGHIEAGRRLPSVQVLVALADYFDTSLDYIAGRTGNQSSIAAIDEDLQTGGISGRLGEIYRLLPPNRQQDVYKFAESLQALAFQEQASESEVQRFVHAMLNAFERRLGNQTIEVVLDELAREFPALTAGLDVSTQPRKKKLS